MSPFIFSDRPYKRSAAANKVSLVQRRSKTSESTRACFPILRLPQELRDLIYDFVFEGIGVVPRGLTIVRSTKRLEFISQDSEGRSIPNSSHPSEALALSLVNHQISAEAVTRFYGSKMFLGGSFQIFTFLKGIGQQRRNLIKTIVCCDSTPFAVTLTHLGFFIMLRSLENIHIIVFALIGSRVGPEQIGVILKGLKELPGQISGGTRKAADSRAPQNSSKSKSVLIISKRRAKSTGANLEMDHKRCEAEESSSTTSFKRNHVSFQVERITESAARFDDLQIIKMSQEQPLPPTTTLR